MKPAPTSQKTILILTGSIGSGHLSVAKAIKEAIHRANGTNVRVEVVDLLTAFENFVTSATKKIYLNSLKLSPKIYELLFSQSDENEWPLQVLNAITAPFMQKQFLAMLKEKQPSVLVSTYPVWDILIKKVWEKYNTSKLPFVSVITDAMHVHASWIYGEPDYFIVANPDTATALEHFDIHPSRIKTFGYPIANRFIKHTSCANFQREMDLSPRRKTLLLILSTGISWSKVKQAAKTIRGSSLKNLQLVIVACGDTKWVKKLEKMRWPWPTRVTGWTNHMHEFIHGSDIILTKAGGATVMECIVSQKPMIIIDAIPGHEIGNAMLVQKYNLGVVLNRSLSDFDHAVEYIFSHDALIKKNLISQKRPHAAEETAKFLLQLVDEH